ncbi:MAG: ABC transporter substrate-binding protein [Desulfurococcales archaeon]|nr:ABC transporter substrate-binding protein [Desulfurococcales archaeon]
MSHLRVAVALIAILALAVAVPAVISPSAQAQTTIRIGGLLPLTGDLQSYGVRAQAAVEVAVESVNAFLEEQNAWFRFELVVEDTQTKPDVAVSKYNSLVAQGIKFIVGPMTSAEVKKLKDLATQQNVLLISPSSTAIELAIPGDNVFRFCPADDVQSQAVASLLRDFGISGVVMINRADTWGEGLKNAIVERLDALNIEVRNVYSYNPESPDFPGIAAQANSDVEELIAKYGANKVAVIAIGFSEIVSLFSEASAYPTLSKVFWVGSDGTANLAEFLKDPIASSFAESTLFINPIFSPARTSVQEKVIEAVKAKIGEEPDAYAMAAHDAVWALALAFLQVGPTDDVDELVNKAKELIPQIVESDEFAQFAATGKFPLNDAGDRATADYDWWIIRGGEWVKVGVYKGIEDANEWIQLPEGETFPELVKETFQIQPVETPREPVETTPMETTPEQTTPSPTETTPEESPTPAATEERAAEKTTPPPTTPEPAETPEETSPAEEEGISGTIVAAVIVLIIIAVAAALLLRR